MKRNLFAGFGVCVVFFFARVIRMLIYSEQSLKQKQFFWLSKFGRVLGCLPKWLFEELKVEKIRQNYISFIVATRLTAQTCMRLELNVK